ncbi:hypothetical protein, partial [Candidatus Thiosymbion oneisti]|uniref:hypothetical protein n=1 Tax=Candidatus Thiosymbion oneisti TaxID=589554 RepID=UPI001C407D27
SVTGDTSGVGRESGHLGSTRAAATALSPSHNAFVGNGYLAKSKAAAGLCHLAAPPLILALSIPVSIGVRLPPHSKTSGGPLP